MDVVILGKKEWSLSARPYPIYVGQDRNEAAEAIAKTAGEYPYIFEISTLPIRRIAAPKKAKTVLTEGNEGNEEKPKKKAKA